MNLIASGSLLLQLSGNSPFLVSLGLGTLGAVLGTVLAYLVQRVYGEREYPQIGGIPYAPLAFWRGDILLGMGSGWVTFSALALLLTSVPAQVRLLLLLPEVFWPVLVGGLVLAVLLLALRFYLHRRGRARVKVLAQRRTSPVQLFTTPAIVLLLVACAGPYILPPTLQRLELSLRLAPVLLFCIAVAGSYLILLLILVAGWLLERTPLPLLTLPLWLAVMYPLAGQTYRRTRWARDIEDPRELPRLLASFGADSQLNRDLRLALRRLVTKGGLPLEQVIEALQDNRPAVRSNISETLVSLGDTRVALPLLALLGDPDLGVRSVVMAALARLGTPHGIPVVLCLLGSALQRGMSPEATALVCVALPLIRDGATDHATELLERALALPATNPTSTERLTQALAQLTDPARPGDKSSF